MGLLSRQAIMNCLQDGSIEIDPPPDEADYDSDSVDVHLGAHVYEWAQAPPAATVSIALWKEPPQGFQYRTFADEYLKEVLPDNAGIITLRPHTFYLADLRQRTTLPPDVAMQIQGKSSLARLGVMVHLTAPHAHAGWTGRLTLEIYNLGPFNIELKPGLAIGQLTFWRVEGPVDTGPSGGQFAHQRDARGSAG